MVAYDRLIEQTGVFYITYDNTEVGREQARGVFNVKPEGNYVFIKGSPTDPNANFLRDDQGEVLEPNALLIGQHSFAGQLGERQATCRAYFVAGVLVDHSVGHTRQQRLGAC